MPRFHCPVPLSEGSTISLPAGAARHVQVLRLQPGNTITLFNGEGGECEATVTRMGRSEVEARIVSHTAVERETGRAVHLALGVPANERMDWLVEKAVELGVASLQPLQAERSVLRLSGERAEKKRQHWQAIAVAACEQCGRNRVPPVPVLQTLPAWLGGELPRQRLLLSLAADSVPLARQRDRLDDGPVLFLSGPEGGLSPAEEQAARAAGFLPVSLGPRTLRAETAPLAALAALTL
ncbi:MAG: 16S rRNA (uracil(1498)-N(3))-methyltransferase [Hylemonella sp.]|uniref:16S rRNA (uracil(1498)-N(3))-methyltransferase n=1 Tax=Hylemonella sp. TaxID=2066020 RepID=UPI0022C76CB4|nr:16S rRNA (uracil(1498)-N(3))-methyltransferase [Hylemonella sp.]MCZ8252880.1 16S rRNA (uracil(1498)-N(3))-methyltransferase [Hylemonella sp.]